MDSIIELKNVTKAYCDKVVLNGIDLTVKKGEFVTIIGTFGCGKTTLLKLINGLIEPTSGKISVYGKDISSLNLIELRRSIGYVIQGAALFPHMIIRENINYVLKIMKKKEIYNDKNALRRLLEITMIDDDLLDRYPSELSGGQQQRVGIARALATKPGIVLMDEPFGSLDEITRKVLQDEILSIHKSLNMTIVFITHDIKEAFKLGDHIVIINQGVIEQEGTSCEVKENPKTDFVKSLIASLYA